MNYDFPPGLVAKAMMARVEVVMEWEKIRHQPSEQILVVLWLLWVSVRPSV